MGGAPSTAGAPSAGAAATSTAGATLTAGAATSTVEEVSLEGEVGAGATTKVPSVFNILGFLNSSINALISNLVSNVNVFSLIDFFHTPNGNCGFLLYHPQFIRSMPPSDVASGSSFG